MKVSKFKLKGYFEPTPPHLRKLGDSLLGISQFAAGYSIISDSKELTIVFMVMGMVGKALTNFFVEEADINNSNAGEKNL